MMSDKKEFEKTFKSYDKMTKGEKAAFKQGAHTANQSIKEKLGLKKPRS